MDVFLYGRVASNAIQTIPIGRAKRRRIVIQIDRETCVGCGGCVDLCPRTAICFIEDRAFIDVELCLECKTCVNVCPVQAPRAL